MVTPTVAGQLTNTASVQGGEADPNPANNSVTASTTVTADACPPEIRFGQTIHCSIDAPGEMDSITFPDGRAGDRVRVRVVETSGRLVAYTGLVDGATICGPSTQTELTCLLAGDGPHTIRVQDLGGRRTGDYWLAVQRLNNPVGCTPVGFGDPPVAATISQAAEMDCFTFPGAVGDRVRVRVAEVAGSPLVTSTEVVGPNGTTAVNCPPNNQTEMTCPLDANGSHTIIVRDQDGRRTGDYWLAVQRLNNPVNCTGVGFGIPMDNSIDEVAEMDCFTILGAVGDRVRVQKAEAAGSRLVAYIEVVRPDGSPVPGCGATRQPDLRCRLDANGPHTIIVRDLRGTNTGGYQLTVTKS
jgi:hypothetical protein